VASRLCAVENDLVDAYVRGTLAGGMLERFESFYLASPRRHEKVMIARDLRCIVDRGNASVKRRLRLAPRPSDGAAPE
jgi:hypothetical protein